MTEKKVGFGEYLVGLGILTTDQLKKATQDQKRGERLEQALVRLNLMKEELALQHLADYFNLPYVDLDTYLIDEKVVQLIPEETARRHMAVPLFRIGNTLTVALTNPLNLLAVDEVRSKTGADVDIALSTERKIQRAIDQHYGVTAATFETTWSMGQTEWPLPGTSRLSEDVCTPHSEDFCRPCRRCSGCPAF